MSVYKVGDPLRGERPLGNPLSTVQMARIDRNPLPGLDAENQYGADIQVIKLGNSCPNILLLLLEGRKGVLAGIYGPVSAILGLI